ncbi:hypothetical protein CPC08DRAFT_713300 [Agrocybe pediades]|nr:hypothetical protein CPC08DRAFT_713300 [Agrocybe pediades]
MPSIITRFKSAFTSPSSRSPDAISPTSPPPATSPAEGNEPLSASSSTSNSSANGNGVQFAPLPSPTRRIVRTRSTPALVDNDKSSSPSTRQTRSRTVSSATFKQRERPGLYQAVRIPSIPGYCF